MLIIVIIGAVLGLSIAGPAGLLVGAAFGYGAGYFLSRARGVNQEAFLDATFAVMGALCKADGRVTQDEIRVAEQFFGRLGLSEDQRRAARAAFNRGKEPGFDPGAEIGRLHGVVHGNRALLQLFLQVQLSAIAADGVLHDEERRMLLHVARLLGLSEVDVARLEAALGAASAAGAGNGAGSAHGVKPLDDAYATLGVDASASDAEIKKAYRRMMNKHHPDKLAARGMPESMRPVAKERTQKIREAYDRIRGQRERQSTA